MARTIETKLRRDVLFSTYRIERIRRHWLHRLGWVNAYSTEIMAAASAAGFVSPFIAASQGVSAAHAGAGETAQLTTARVIGDQALLDRILGTPLTWIGAGLFILAVVLRVIDVIHAMNEKYVIGRAALGKIADFQGQIRLAMQDEDCVGKLNDFASTAVRPAFDMARQVQCMPRFKPKDEEEMKGEVDAFVEQLRADFPEKLALEIEGQR